MERTQNLDGVEMLGGGLRAINNVIHHGTRNGIGAWNYGPGQILYGNIIYENGSSFNEHGGHGIYTQNSYDKYGYKHIVNNMLLDSASVKGNISFNFHAYAEGNELTGFWVEKNIVRNGRFLIGGFNKPVSDCIVKENYFYRSGPQLGYRRPTQSQVISNYVGRGRIETAWFWGEGETIFTKPGPNIYRGNTVLLPDGPHVVFRTSAFLPSGRCEGCTGIPAADIFDFNQYSLPFSADFHATNTAVQIRIDDVQMWRATTSAAGNSCRVLSIDNCHRQ